MRVWAGGTESKLIYTGTAIENVRKPRAPGEGLFRRQDSLYANCYVTKPVDLEQFVQVVKSIEDFGLTIVKLPQGKTP